MYFFVTKVTPLFFQRVFMVLFESRDWLYSVSSRSYLSSLLRLLDEIAQRIHSNHLLIA